MCGIFGFIGKSTNPKATYALITALAIKTEPRGKESTGFWGTQGGEDGQIIYHKEPIPSSEMINRDMWKLLKGFNPDLFLGHCREPTLTAGSPKVNKNNHPHVSANRTVAMIHNGKVEEYQTLKNKSYWKDLKGDCDSEIILRMFERGNCLKGNTDWLQAKYPEFEPEFGYRLYGLEHIFAKLNNGAMAVAVGERHEGHRRSLWLFRDDKRPLHLIDLRKSLGQIFFCSTLAIWRESVDSCEAKHYIPQDHSILEIPVLTVYSLNIDETAPDENKINRWNSGWMHKIYTISRERVVGEEVEESLPDAVARPFPVKVLSKLDDKEEVVEKAEIREMVLEIQEEEGEEEATQEAVSEIVNKDAEGFTYEPETTPDKEFDVQVTFTKGGKKEAPSKPIELPVTKSEELDRGKFDLLKLLNVKESFKELLESIHTDAHNAALEGSITPYDFQQLIDDLETAKAELEASKIANFNIRH